LQRCGRNLSTRLRGFQRPAKHGAQSGGRFFEKIMLH
jgi:hypothetical protein